MNKTRRKEIAALVTIMNDVRDRLEFVGNEEQEAFDNMPEGLQGTEMGEKMEEAVQALEDAEAAVDEIIESIEIL